MAVIRGGEDEPISMAQQLPRKLHSKDQLQKGVLDQERDFAFAVELEPLVSKVEGLQSLEQYQDRKKAQWKVDHLRELGLTSQEIELKLTDSGEESQLPCSAKRRKLAVEPSAHRERVKALNEKICNREEMLKQPLIFAGAHHMTRHAEKSLYLDRGSPLTLTVQDSQCHAYPKSQQINPCVGTNTEVHTSSGKMEGCDSSGCVLALPSQVIERNRLTEAEIRALPRFRDYCQGEPSKVLYLKNLHQAVCTEDLQAVFGSLQESATSSNGCSGDSDVSKKQEELHIRLMKGKMRGQAFVEFSRVSDAVRGLKAVNGFVMRGKPVIICYGRKK